MEADDPIDAAFDEYLDRALRGAAPAPEEFLLERDGLEPAARERLRLRIESLRGHGAGAELPFERLGEFRLLERLGQGGMGVVFLAEAQSLGKRVALKLLRPELAASPDAQRRFEREARAVSKLRHANIVAVHAAGTEQGVRYIALELVEGRSLDELLLSSGGALEPARAVAIALDLARALEAAHTAGVIHRDLKPSNVRLSSDGRALLLDFGLAHLDGASTLSRSGSFHGTPFYAAPEQVDPRGRTLDARCDVYGLGATLYECATGRRPFEGESNTEVFQRILLGDPTPPRRLQPALTRDLETVILKALAKRPEERYASAAEFAGDLEALLAVRPIRARPAGPWRRARRWFARRPLVSTAAGTVLLAALASVAVLLVQAQRRAGEFVLACDSAEAAASRGEFETALRDYDRALGLAPQDARALSRRSEIEQAFTHSRERALVEEGRAALERYKRRRSEAQALEAGLEPLERGITTRYLSPAEERQLARDEDRSGELARGLEQDFAAVLQALERARGLDPADAEIDSLLADAYCERWHEAQERRDRAGERRMGAILREHDREGRYATELAGLGSVALSSDPPGAEVFLFRFEEQSELSPEGEHRLVPLPVDAASGAQAPCAVTPGTWVLRVVEGAGELVPGDLIVRVAGRPIQGTILVAGAKGELHDFDRLVSIGGREVHDILDANALGAPLQSGEPREFVFERDGRNFTLRAADSKEFGVGIPSLSFLVEHVVAPLAVLRDGRELELSSAPGLRVRQSAIPLCASPACRLGETPIAARALPRGSYLALVRGADRELLRAPFVVEQGHETRLELRLCPAGSSPPGFVFVPGGPFRAGGDPLAYAAWPAATREVADFWIAERETTENEYVEFLNDPQTQDEIGTSPSLIRVPRKAADAERGGSWERDAEGHYRVRRPNSNFAVSSISPDDARAYAAWRSARARAAGEAFEYALPSEEEWEKAARGVDGRLFVFGDSYSPGWMKSLYARDEHEPYVGHKREPGLRFPIDESVYGVFDLCGNMWEACADVWDPAAGAIAIRGGAATFMYAASFHAAARAGVHALDAQDQLGFRLVAHRHGGG